MHWDDPEGWCGGGGGRGAQDWEHLYTRGGFMLIFSLFFIFCCERYDSFTFTNDKSG